MIQTKRNRHIIVVGGGFGGVRTAAKLSRHSELNVTLISTHHTFAYYPQFYHAATGGTRAEIALPLTDLIDDQPVGVVTDTIVALDAEARTVTGATGEIYKYDTLVLALGNVTNYFGITGLEEFAFDIKTINGTEKFRRHIHRQILDTHAPNHTYTIVGGGPTGIEMAGSLGQYVESISALHNLAAPKFKVQLIEGAPRLLPRLPEAFAAKVHARLEKLGVEVVTGAVVKGETATKLNLAGKSIATSTVVWTAGTANNPFYAAHADVFTMVKPGRVHVNGHMEVRPNLYVVGDNAATPFSGLAETAINDANYVAEDIWRKYTGRRRPTYAQPHPSTVIPVGENWAAAQLGPVTLYGYPAFMVRRIADLIGYADVQKWPSALRVWLKDRQRDTGCPICG